MSFREHQIASDILVKLFYGDKLLNYKESCNLCLCLFDDIFYYHQKHNVPTWDSHLMRRTLKVDQ